MAERLKLHHTEWEASEMPTLAPSTDILWGLSQAFCLVTQVQQASCCEATPALSLLYTACCIIPYALFHSSTYKIACHQ